MDWNMLAAITAIIVAVFTAATFIGTKIFTLGKMSKTVDEHDGKISNFAEKMFELGRLSNTVDEHTSRIARIDSKLDSIEKIVRENSEDINSIKTVLLMKYKNMEDILTRRHSPRMLNELGEKIFNDMNGAKFLEDNKDLLFSRIDREKPKAALDVERAANFATIAIVSNDVFIPIKTYIYNCPAMPLPDGKFLDMDIETACYVLSIPLRDMYLDAHREIPR